MSRTIEYNFFSLIQYFVDNIKNYARHTIN